MADTLWYNQGITDTTLTTKDTTMNLKRIARKNGHHTKAPSNATHTLRRAAMAYIYEAKALAEAAGVAWERVTIRITEGDAHKLGLALLGGGVVWINATACLAYGPATLRHVVLHEIIHAVRGVRHDETAH